VTASWRLRLATGCLVAISAVACARRTPRAPEPRTLPAAASSQPAADRARRAFYYWRTTLQLSARERRTLAALDVGRLYLRLFDVDQDDADPAPRPVAPLVVPGGSTAPGRAVLPPGVEAVPVVFIRERVLRRLEPAAGQRLAEQIWREVTTTMAALRGGASVRELQIDCDWTATTQAAYFALLDRLGERARAGGAVLTATIRLHQIKYRERTGVPPVARGMLMFYNMGRIEADPESQAIFDHERAAAYLARLAAYPLPLDVALPIWSWVRHVRGDQVVGLMQDTDAADLADKGWLRRLDARRFEVSETAFLDGVLLRRGDLLEPEQSTPATTLAAATMLATRLPATPGGRTIALFHLSDKSLAHYETSDLDHVFASLP
jgi:hypothetical protein